MKTDKRPLIVQWQSIEQQYDSKQLTDLKRFVHPTLSGFNLGDFLTILNWTGYARGIGDKSVKMTNVDGGFSKSIYKLAKKRSKKYLNRNEVKPFS